MSTQRKATILFAAVDTVALLVIFVAAVALRFAGWTEGFFDYRLLLPKAFVHALVFQVCLYYSDLYDVGSMGRRVELLLRAGQATLFAVLTLSLVYFAVPPLNPGRPIVLLFLPLTFLHVVLGRSVYFWAWGRESFCETVLILGTGQSAVKIAREILDNRGLGFRVAGFLSEHAVEVGRRLVNPSVIGTIDQLPELVWKHKVTLIVVAQEDRRGRMPIEQLLECRMAGVRVEEAPSLYETLTGKILVTNLRPSWLVFSQGFNKPRLLRNVKRVGEFCISLLALALTAPLLGLLAVLVKLDSPGPVFYRQERIGEKGRRFLLIKLRTMRVDAEAKTGPVWASSEGDPRLTRLGAFLRKARLDELPQLLNVLRGEMSFVGPRPERAHFVEKLRTVIPYYDERHSVKPGITGWAQIRFRYGSTVEDAEEKLQYDLYYIKHMSLAFDLGIIFDTLKVVVLGRGAR
jgi:sugar transferase (PEP-CTERM system associated)